jgi:hypothetical protein
MIRLPRPSSTTTPPQLFAATGSRHTSASTKSWLTVPPLREDAAGRPASPVIGRAPRSLRRHANRDDAGTPRSSQNRSTDSPLASCASTSPRDQDKRTRPLASRPVETPRRPAARMRGGVYVPLTCQTFSRSATPRKDGVDVPLTTSLLDGDACDHKCRRVHLHTWRIATARADRKDGVEYRSSGTLLVAAHLTIIGTFETYPALWASATVFQTRQHVATLNAHLVAALPPPTSKVCIELLAKECPRGNHDNEH